MYQSPTRVRFQLVHWACENQEWGLLFCERWAHTLMGCITWTRKGKWVDMALWETMLECAKVALGSSRPWCTRWSRLATELQWDRSPRRRPWRALPVKSLTSVRGPVKFSVGVKVLHAVKVRSGKPEPHSRRLGIDWLTVESIYYNFQPGILIRIIWRCEDATVGHREPRRLGKWNHTSLCYSLITNESKWSMAAAGWEVLLCHRPH